MFVCATISHLLLLLLGLDFRCCYRLSLNALRPFKINRGKTRTSTVTWRNSWLKKKKLIIFFSFFYLRWVNIGSAVRSGKRSRKKEQMRESWLISIMKAAEKCCIFLQSRTHTRKKKCQYYTLHFIRCVLDEKKLE